MRMVRVLSLLAVAGLLVAACGDDDGGSTSSETPFAQDEADVVSTAFDIGFREDSYSADAGDIDVFYLNEGALHTLLVRDAEGDDVPGFKLQVNQPGDADAGTVSLDAGEYMLYCDIPGHEQAGMIAPFTVS